MKEILEKLSNRWDIELKQTTDKNIAESIKKKQKELNKITQIQKEIEEYEFQILESKDIEINEIFKEEILKLQTKIEENFEEFKSNQTSKEESIILEIRSGEGGQEAELFALELLEMYKKLCKKMNWIFKLFDISTKESGGIKGCTGEIIGKGVNIYLNQESGVHCVKRVPKTEKRGRTHTSTATVAILKQPNEVEVIINDKDLKIEVFRSSGPGGQSVNTTDSAVRITHIPTNIVVSQQDEKSQIKNKEKALKILKARIYEKKLEEETQKNENERREAIGSAKRNERVRTYHFTQNWINDTRIALKSHNIAKFMDGDELILFLNELILTTI
ncbi:PCRF domain-containing protein [Alphaproteobacteria bacterium endosymbiont of Tiliacea citrago]|uniref:PCRF domain-containing protein n=1 Tax=Alphaproteobacteria bacterium endosymbiont of Tiliacea citrago TaxID=3077944 RepID=UPI00313C25A6